MKATLDLASPGRENDKPEEETISKGTGLRICRGLKIKVRF